MVVRMNVFSAHIAEIDFLYQYCMKVKVLQIPLVLKFEFYVIYYLLSQETSNVSLYGHS